MVEALELDERLLGASRGRACIIVSCGCRLRDGLHCFILSNSLSINQHCNQAGTELEPHSVPLQAQCSHLRRFSAHDDCAANRLPLRVLDSAIGQRQGHHVAESAAIKRVYYVLEEGGFGHETLDVDIAQKCLARLLFPLDGFLCQQDNLVPSGGAHLVIGGAAKGID